MLVLSLLGVVEGEACGCTQVQTMCLLIQHYIEVLSLIEIVIERAPCILNIVKVSYAVLVSLPVSAGKLDFDHIIVSHVYHMHTLHSSDLFTCHIK